MGRIGVSLKVGAVGLVVAMVPAGPAMGRAAPPAAPVHGATPRSPNYAAAILADGPAIYWRLGDLNSTTAADASGNGRDGTYRGVGLGYKGAIVDDPDTSVHFDGYDDSMSWGPGVESYSGPFSVEAWVFPGRGTREHDFFSTRKRYRVHDYSFHIKLSTRLGIRGVRLGVGDGTAWFVEDTIPFAWRAQVWYDVVAVADTTGVTVYVDGVSIGTLPYAGTPLLYDRVHPVSIGQSGNGNEWFRGKIDEVSVYQYALTTDQITAHYTAATGQ